MYVHTKWEHGAFDALTKHTACGVLQIDDINEDFTAAREEIDYAKEDAETTYFNESCETAREAVESVLNKYKQVLDALSEDERAKLQRSMGLKMEQLKVRSCFACTTYTWHQPVLVAAIIQSALPSFVTLQLVWSISTAWDMLRFAVLAGRTAATGVDALMTLDVASSRRALAQPCKPSNAFALSVVVTNA